MLWHASLRPQIRITGLVRDVCRQTLTRAANACSVLSHECMRCSQFTTCIQAEAVPALLHTTVKDTIPHRRRPLSCTVTWSILSSSWRSLQASCCMRSHMLGSSCCSATFMATPNPTCKHSSALCRCSLQVLRTAALCDRVT